MARAYVNQNSYYPYHVTGRTPNRELFKIPIDWVWCIFEDYLYYLNRVYDFKIHAFVLMPNHFHLICSSPQKNIGEAIQELMWKTSKEMNTLSGRINQNWGGRHYKCEIKHEVHLLNTYKYVYQNPIRAKLCNSVLDWKFSTLHGLVGKSKLIIPVEDSFLFKNNQEEKIINWLNIIIDEKHLKFIKSALTKREFILPKDKNQKLHLLNNLPA